MVDFITNAEPTYFEVGLNSVVSSAARTVTSYYALLLAGSSTRPCLSRPASPASCCLIPSFAPRFARNKLHFHILR